MPKHAPRGPVKMRDPLQTDQPLQTRKLGGDAPRCSAHSKRTGLPCTNPAIKGAVVCRMHGGSAPQVKAAALERLKALQPKAISVLESLLDRQEFPTVQMAAVRDVLDRTEGKAAEQVKVTGADDGPIRHVFSWEK
jgi:hypothetical protein